MITSALHIRGYDPATGTAAEVSPVACPDGMVRQLAIEPYTYVGPLTGHGELTAVVRYFGWLYAVEAGPEEFTNRGRWLSLPEAARLAGLPESALAKVIRQVPGARHVYGVRGDWRIRAPRVLDWVDTLTPEDWRYLRDGGDDA